MLPDRPADASDLNVGCEVRHSKRCRGGRALAAAPSLLRGQARTVRNCIPVGSAGRGARPPVGERPPVRLDDSGHLGHDTVEVLGEGRDEKRWSLARNSRREGKGVAKTDLRIRLLGKALRAFSISGRTDAQIVQDQDEARATGTTG